MSSVVTTAAPSGEVGRGAPPKVAARRSNGFGALRLVFASLVIISHSVEMLDGDQLREPLHAIFGNVSCGGLSVTAFFIISGFLIPESFARDPKTYFWKRILRIYPAYVVCSLLCIFAVAPLAGAHLAALGGADWGRMAYRILMLKAPEVPGVFAGRPYPTLNGSMWTISYEFRCYILVAVFGWLGAYLRPKLFLALTATVCGLYLFAAAPALQARFGLLPGGVVALTGDPDQMLRLLAAFMCGTCFWLFRPRMNGVVAALCFAAMLLAFFVPRLADVAMMTVGAYALFWVALACQSTWLRTLNAQDDVSYGVYLYAWPVGALTIWWWPSVSPVVLMALTFVLAVVCAWCSWCVIEKPCLALKGMGFPAARLGARGRA
jgi:peptidoglycan/LPS O-acetylase OafA/YrhL